MSSRRRFVRKGPLRGFPLVRLLVVVAIIVVGGWYSRSSHAQAAPLVTYGTRLATVVPGAITNGGVANWAANMTTGAVTYTEAATIRVAANDVAMSYGRTIPWGGIMKGAARALPFLTTAALAYTLFDAYRCYAKSGNFSVLSCDAGLAQVVESCNGYAFGGNSYCSPAAYCVALAGTQGLYAGASGGVGSGTYCDGFDAAGNLQSRTFIGSPTPQPGLARCPNPAFVPGADGKCAGGSVVDTSFDDAAQKIAMPLPSSAVDVAREAAAKVDLAPYADPLKGVLTGPSELVDPHPSVTADPVGTTTVQPKYDFEYPGDNTVTWDETDTQTNPDGSTVTTTNPLPPKTEVCGLPGKPVCNVKVDETGTPQADTLPTDVVADLSSKKAEWDQAISDPSAKWGPFPNISWAFALPTNCGPIPLPAFAPYMESADVCAFQPIFHDIMSVVWVLGSLFGAIATFWRDQLSTP